MSVEQNSDRYNRACDALAKNEAAVNSLVAKTRACTQKLSDWKNVTITDVLHDKAALVPSANNIDLSDWPKITEILAAIKEWRDARNEAMSAWADIPLDQQKNLRRRH
jgi:hypothetical protein